MLKRRLIISLWALVLLAVLTSLFLASTAPAHATDWRPSYEMNTGCAGGVAANDNGPAQSDGGAHCMRSHWSMGPTYFATGSGYVAYATPTDMFCLWGSATKTVYVSSFWMGPQSTSATLETWIFVKRSSADTGGSPTTITPLAYDSLDAAPTASFKLYGAAPTLGSSYGILREYAEVTANLTASMTGMSMDGFGSNMWAQIGTTFTLRQPLTLHAGEGICLDFNGAALPGGFTAFYGAEWTEF
jgi:hypothetical protein